jgi:hypothetical protein
VSEVGDVFLLGAVTVVLLWKRVRGKLRAVLVDDVSNRGVYGANCSPRSWSAPVL